MSFSRNIWRNLAYPLTHGGKPRRRSCEGNAKHKHPVRMQQPSCEENDHMSRRNCSISRKIADFFYLKHTPSSNTCYWFYGSHKAFNVAFPIIAVGLPQIIRPYKKLHMESLSRACIGPIMQLYMWHSIYIRWWDACEVFADLSPILHFHSGNAQHVRMQCTSCELLQRSTCEKGL